MAEAILTSWRFDLPFIGFLLLAAYLYIRGWLRLHAQSPQRYTPERLAAYLAGLLTLFLALASPLDAFGNLLLMAHMVQHLMLIVVAPPLILLGQPVLPLLRGLPVVVFKDGLGPFLSCHGLQRAGRRLTHPVVCWFAMTAAILFWHTPRWYDLGLRSTAWHGLEHACFFYGALLFWSPVIGIWPNRPHWPGWMMIPYLVLADIVNTGLSAWLVFSAHVVYRTYELAPRIAGMSALEDQSTAGAIMWVPGSIAFLIPAFIITMRAIQGERRWPEFVRIKPAPRPRSRQPFDVFRIPVLGAVLRKPWFRRAVQAVLFGLALAVVIDGLTGPQIAPLNLAGILPWTYWRGFTVIALLLAGNLFCMACPFTLASDAFSRILPGKTHWPKALRSKWLAIVVLFGYLWANEVFGIWNSPWWTAWVVVGYFAAAITINGLFQGASFCKYVCPIGQFHFVNTLISPLEVKFRSASVCSTCSTEDCISGNASQQGCQLYLFQPMKTGNFDCTFCLDCVHACPNDNVGILAVPPGSSLVPDSRSSNIGRLSQRTDAAALAAVIVFGALASAAVMTDPVMVWMHLVHRALGLDSMLPVTTAFLFGGIVLTPLILVWMCGHISVWLSNATDGWGQIARRFIFAMVPLGAAMWVAHFVFHLLTGWQSAIPVAARILHFAVPTAALAAHVPPWLPTLQILLLDGGLILSVYIAWGMARRETEGLRSAFALLMPWAILATCIYAVAIWILFQPMQMRGMVM